MEESYPGAAPRQPHENQPGTITTSEAPATGTSVTGPTESEMATSGDKVQSEIHDMRNTIAEEASHMSQVIKKRAQKAGRFMANQMSNARQKSREFLSTPTRKFASLGAAALTLGGVIRMRRRHQEEPTSTIDKLKARWS